MTDLAALFPPPKGRRKPSPSFSIRMLACRLYAAGDAAPYGSPERAALYRQAAAAQRQAEAADELARVTATRRRKAA